MKNTKTMKETELLFNSLSPAARKSIHAFACEDPPAVTKRLQERIAKAVEKVFGPGYEEEARQIDEELFRQFCEWRESLINKQ